jgi:hypothetical protein
MSTIYIFIGGRLTIAGDQPTVVTLFKEPLPDLPPDEPITKEFVQSIWPLCSSEVVVAPVPLLNIVGTKIFLYKRLESIISRLCIQNSILNPKIIKTALCIPQIRGFNSSFDFTPTIEWRVSKFIAQRQYLGRLMGAYEEYPQYDWINNRGCPTNGHYLAILKYGPSPLHKRTGLIRLAPWLLRQIEARNPAVRKYARLLKEGPPNWWSKYMQGVDFKAGMTQSELLRFELSLFQYIGRIYDPINPIPTEWQLWNEEHRPPPVY